MKWSDYVLIISWFFREREILLLIFGENQLNINEVKVICQGQFLFPYTIHVYSSRSDFPGKKNALIKFSENQFKLNIYIFKKIFIIIVCLFSMRINKGFYYKIIYFTLFFKSCVESCMFL